MAFKFWQLIKDNMYYDPRLGNPWNIQESRALHFLIWIEKAEAKENERKKVQSMG